MEVEGACPKDTEPLSVFPRRSGIRLLEPVALRKEVLFVFLPLDTNLLAEAGAIRILLLQECSPLVQFPDCLQDSGKHLREAEVAHTALPLRYIPQALRIDCHRYSGKHRDSLF